jgi:gamma-glutamylputrescine oxidase
MPNTWYHSSVERKFLTTNAAIEDKNFDVIIIGGGLTGASAALELAKNGINCAIIEAKKIGHGASGRNGGLVCSGYRHDQSWFEEKLGNQLAKDLWDISEAAKKHLVSILSEYNIDADYQSGLAFCAHNQKMFDYLINDKMHLETKYNYQKLEIIDKANCPNELSTNAYFGAIIDNGAGKINPLKLLYGIAQSVLKYGAKIFENTKANSVSYIGGKISINTNNGDFTAKEVLFCGDGYLGGINPKIEAKVMPISSFVITTEKLDFDILPNIAGAMDTKFVVNYFHKTHDNRLLFGGGEKYTPKWPKDIKNFVRNNLLKIYPQLENVKIDYAWGGSLGITSTRLPFVAEVEKNIYTAAGYSGQGVLFSPFFGTILAKKLLGQKREFATLEKLPVPNFPGGQMLRFPFLTAAMSYYSILDKLP